MTLIAVQEKYLDTLKAFGDVNAQINQVIEDYVTRRIIERVRIARENTREFEAKYAMPYATFAERVQLDEDFYNQVSQAIHCGNRTPWCGDIGARSCNIGTAS